MLVEKKDVISLMIGLALCMELVFNWTAVPIFRSPKNLFLLIALLIYVPLAIKENTIFFASRSWPFISLIFALLFTTVVTEFFSSIEGEKKMNINELIITSGAPIIFLIVYNTLDTEKRISFALMLGSVFFSISCIFVILQYFNIDLAWQIRGLFGFRVEGGEIERQFLARSKPFGLNYYSINFSYSIALMFPYVFLQSISYNSYKWIYKIIFPIYLIALIMLNVKSVILGVGIFFITRWIRLNSRMRIFKIFIILFSLVIIINSLNLILPYLSPSTITSFLVRIPLALMGFILLWNHPLGLPNNVGYHELAEYYLPLINHIPLSESVLKFTPHNYFLTYGISNFGIISIFIAILIFILPIFIAFKVKHNTYYNNINVQSVALGWGIIVYIVNDMLHNGGPLMGHQLYFFICAIIYKLHTLKIKM